MRFFFAGVRFYCFSHFIVLAVNFFYSHLMKEAFNLNVTWNYYFFPYLFSAVCCYRVILDFVICRGFESFNLKYKLVLIVGLLLVFGFCWTLPMLLGSYLISFGESLRVDIYVIAIHLIVQFLLILATMFYSIIKKPWGTA